MYNITKYNAKYLDKVQILSYDGCIDKRDTLFYLVSKVLFLTEP